MISDLKPDCKTADFNILLPGCYHEEPQNQYGSGRCFQKLVAHCKEYGYVFPSSEIYDGLGVVYDYGQYGVELKNNIKKYWWDSMVLLNENIVGLGLRDIHAPDHLESFRPC